MHDPALTTGLPSLDQVLKGLLPGDNVVWQVDAWKDNRSGVTPMPCRLARQELVYSVRGHEPLLPADGAPPANLDRSSSRLHPAILA